MSSATERVSRVRSSAHELPRGGGELVARAFDLRLALAGGGTGGHIVPGLHLLASARERRDERAAPFADVVWFTSGRAVETRVLAGLDELAAPAKVERVVLPLEPEGGGAPSRASLLLRTPRAVARARAALVAHRSQALIGLGGFTALPAVLAARSLGVPVALLEVNATQGTATRWLARFATRVFHAWPGSMQNAGAKHVHTGAPLAPEIARGAPDDATCARARAELGFEVARPLLVVLGGSQGASALNRFVRAHAPALVASGVQVLHQTGPDRGDEGLPAFSGYRAVAYVDPVSKALAAATAVLCRGGASTLAEVAAMQRPAWVVPYPHHPDKHQEKNALELGLGVRIVHEERLTLALRHEIASLCDERGAPERARMSAALASAIRVDGAARIEAELVELARKSNGA